MYRSLLLVVLSLSILLRSIVAAQDASYTFTQIEVPGATDTVPIGINSHGQIVGTFGDAARLAHGFLTSDGLTFTTIDVPGAVSTFANGINNRGQIVGDFNDATGRTPIAF